MKQKLVVWQVQTTLNDVYNVDEMTPILITLKTKGLVPLNTNPFSIFKLKAFSYGGVYDFDFSRLQFQQKSS